MNNSKELPCSHSITESRPFLVLSSIIYRNARMSIFGNILRSTASSLSSMAYTLVSLSSPFPSIITLCMPLLGRNHDREATPIHSYPCRLYYPLTRSPSHRKLPTPQRLSCTARSPTPRSRDKSCVYRARHQPCLPPFYTPSILIPFVAPAKRK